MNAFALALALATADCPEPPELASGTAARLGLCQFPSRYIADKNWHFGMSHLLWLDEQIGIEKKYRLTGDYNHNARWLAYLEDWRVEADRSRACWGALSDAHDEMKDGPYPGIDYVHPADKLYRLLGRDDYVAGRMPPAAPFHRFALEK